MTDRQKRFIDLLRTIFELDKSDLDFGIYRILNIRSAEIEKFFTEELPKKITDTLAPFAQGDTGELKAEMKRIEDEAIAYGTTIEEMPDDKPKKLRWNEIRRQLAQGTDIAALESDVYSALYSFFNRYYDEGDFISKRRYKEGVYAIPYEGEEVKLYWANQDQYYIKTSENFKDYTFVADDVTVHFRLIDATTEQGNKKELEEKKRHFFLFTPNEDKHPGIDRFIYNHEQKELTINFVYDISRDKISNTKLQDSNNEIITNYIIKNCSELMPILLKLAPTKKNPNRTLLRKHLDSYVQKNSFDFFIHKDLGGFLTRELDFYIKNEIMHLDDLDTDSEARVNTYLAKVRAIKRVGKIIIAFLAQIENFQKKLWLKKKFVVETQWCITLDRVPEEFYPEIAANAAQVQEWISLFGIDLIKGNQMFGGGFSTPLTIDFLINHKNLVIDTAHFSQSFKQKLIASIDNLDNSTNGLLIFSENFQALNLISNRFKNKVNGCYIDPPFNLGESAEYVYKVDYKDSTWLSLLEDRLILLKSLLDSNGSVFVRCSHDGNMILRLLLNQVFGSDNYRNEIILRRAEETKGDLNKQFESIKSITVNYDNLYWFSKLANARFSKIVKPISSTKSSSHWHSFWKAMDRPTMRYKLLGIDLTTHYGQWMWERNRAERAAQNYEDYLKEFERCGISLDDYWHNTGECLEFIKREGDAIGSIKYWIPPRTEIMADTNWLDIKGYANKWGFKTENSEGVVKRVVDSLSQEKDIVIDFFLGSGTTAAVALKTKRYFIGVDMGEHFYTIALPRIKLVLNGEKSGVSKDCSYEGGGIVKYMRLESYEDALSNIELKKPGAGSLFGDDYLLHYMLDIEARGSLLNLKAFTNPFEYKLLTTKFNESHETLIDVVETFNYLIGLTVINEGAVNYFRAVDAAKPDYEGAVELVRDANGEYAFRLIEGKLPDGRMALVIWRTMGTDLVRTNAALDAYFRKYRINPRESSEYDVIFVNGDNNLENLRTDDEHWKVVRTETAFNDKMWEE